MEGRYSVITSHPDENSQRSRPWQGTCGASRCTLAAIAVGVLALGLAIGFVIGYSVNVARTPAPATNASLPDGFPKGLLEDADPRISGLLLSEINASNIRSFHRNLTTNPHLAGTAQENETAQLISWLWKDWGFDSVRIVEHDVLLSYPDVSGDAVSSIALKNSSGAVLFASSPMEKPLRPEENRTDIVPPFNAYSAPCFLTSQKLIYVNYAMDDDFRYLKNNSVNLTGAILIARYGRIFRANKVQLAEQQGAAGIVLYTDPADYAAPGATDVYPDSWWLPGSGVQRGTVKMDDGDPLTPGYPATKSAFRLDEHKAGLPKICSHPIGYDDARALLERIGGQSAPLAWQGGLSNLTYRIGPELLLPGSSVEMNVTTSNQRRPTYSVIGIIEGSVEPDRYVMLGNHHDAWVFGALDPSSGTAAMLELARAFTTVMRKAAWRPKRSIAFCAWGAEEHGIVGSTEFIEQFVKPLTQRAVAYINVDILLEGTDFLRTKATPAVQYAVYAAARKVDNPNATELAAGRTTVFDSWLYYSADAADGSRPLVTAPGSGSDFAPFMQFVGVECADVRYTYSQNYTRIQAGSYPLYHTLYETTYLVDHLMDPGFNISRAVTQVWGELVRDLSDSMILPLNATTVAELIGNSVDAVRIQYEGILNSSTSLNDRVGRLLNAVSTLKQAAAGLTARMATANRMNPIAVRLLNDQLMGIQRSFIDPMGLPGTPLLRNVIFAPSQFNSYAGSVFPGLSDALYRIQYTGTSSDLTQALNKQLSVLTFVLESAASTLRTPTQFVEDAMPYGVEAAAAHSV